MSIEQAIHDHWAGSAALAALLPADRFRTGWVAPPGTTPDAVTGPAERPYVVLARRGELEVVRASGNIELVALVLRFTVWARDLAEGKAIAAAIHERFDRQHFAAGGASVQDMKRIGTQETPQDDGSWRVELDYLVRAEV
jgi:hypothetical protein